jgi:hypothetical protein
MCRPGIEFFTNDPVTQNCCVAAQKRFLLFKGSGSFPNILKSAEV